MLLTFSWPAAFRREIPTCTADIEETGGFSPLARIVMDDGGINREARISWLREGMRLAAEAELSASDVGSPEIWAGEECEAVIGRRATRVNYLLEDGYQETMSTVSFRHVLEEWVRFLLTGPTTDSVAVVVRIE